MFGLFRKKSAIEDPADPKIFKFHDGTRSRKVDPLEVWSRLEAAAGEEWPELLKIIRLPLPPRIPNMDTSNLEKDVLSKQRQAADTLAKIVPDAFGVTAFDDAGGKSSGLTRTQRIELVARFVVFMAELSEKARPFKSSQPLTG